KVSAHSRVAMKARSTRSHQPIASWLSTNFHISRTRRWNRSTRRFASMAIAQTLGLKAEQVLFHTEMAGGGFGRRAVPDSHVQREAAEIAKKLRGTTVKLIWTREDDVRGGFYRPMFFHRVEIGVGTDGMPAAWRHVVVGQSIMEGTPFAMMMKDGIDPTVAEGITDTQYNLANFNVSIHQPKVNV